MSVIVEETIGVTDDHEVIRVMTVWMVVVVMVWLGVWTIQAIGEMDVATAVVFELTILGIMMVVVVLEIDT